MGKAVLSLRVDESAKLAYDSLPDDAKDKIRGFVEIVVMLMSRGVDVNIVESQFENEKLELCRQLLSQIEKIRSATVFTRISSNSVVDNSIQRLLYLIESRLCRAAPLAPRPAAPAVNQAGGHS
jgi:hypothetical protein